MKPIGPYRFRKCSDIAMERPFFEVLDQQDDVLLDVSRTEEGELRVLFNQDIASRWISLDDLTEMLVEGRRLFSEA